MADLPPEDSPAAGQPAAVQAAFLKLRSSFLSGLPQRWTDIQAAPTDAALQQALHRLAGAAGSYGCIALGDAARAAEQALGQDATTFSEALLQLQQLVGLHSDTVR